MSVCPACGLPLQPGQRICASCSGRSASAAARNAAKRGASTKAAAPVVEERKQATILFADVCGSTAHIKGFDVEEARDYLAPATHSMREAVQAYGGSVYRVEGDAVLAVFGAPLGQEDQALRACLAAVDIQRRANEQASSGAPVVVRVGINSGEVIAWKDPESHTDRVDGKSIHLTKRIEELARPGTVVLSGATFRLVSEELDAVPMGTHEIRDLGKVELFDLSTTSQRSAVHPLARRRQMGPLVGREDLLAALGAVAEQVRAGNLRIVGLRGEAGIGKSRVSAEYAKQLRGQGFRDHWVCGRSYATHIPYAVVADLIRVLIGVPDTDVQRQREAVHAIVAQWPEAQRKHWSAVADLLDLGQPEESWLSLTPAQRRRHVMETVHWLISTRVADGPVMIVVDDIYLADRESQRLIDSLVRRLDNMPVLICATYREDFENHWMNSSWFTEQWLGPLPTSDLGGLARELLGTDESVALVVDALIERADGNPFFLEQMTMTLVDDATLVGTPGAYRCGHAEAELRLPASIATIIGARVDRLPPAAKVALESAAIVGWPISGEVIGAMQKVDAALAEGYLRAAQSSGLLVPSAPGNPKAGTAAARFEFRHGLVQEAVAAALTRPRRKALHRAAFDALRTHFAERCGEHASVLAHHAYHGEAWAEAAEFAPRSMSRSIARSANRDALRVFALGLDATRRLSDEEAMLRCELALRLEALGAQLPLGLIDELVGNLERAEAITRKLGDKRRQAGVSLQLAVVLWTRGSYRQGLEAARNATATALTAGSRSVQMAAMQARMLLHHGLGQYRDVVAAAHEIEREFRVELAARQIMPGWAVIAAVNLKVFLADVLCRMAKLDEAQQACDAAYREVAQHEHAFSRVLIDFVQAEVWMAQQRHADAARLLKTTLASCKSNDLPTMYPPILAILAGSMAGSGQAPAAVALLEKAIADKVFLAGGRYNDYYFPKYLAIALAQAGRYEEAITAAAHARAAAASHEQRGHETDALVLMAEIESDAGRSQDALLHFREALAAALLQETELVARRCRAGIERGTGQPLAAGGHAAGRNGIGGGKHVA